VNHDPLKRFEILEVVVKGWKRWRVSAIQIPTLEVLKVLQHTAYH